MSREKERTHLDSQNLKQCKITDPKFFLQTRIKKIQSNIVDFGKIEMKNMVEIVNSVKASANSAKGFAVSLR